MDGLNLSEFCLLESNRLKLWTAAQHLMFDAVFECHA